MGRKAFNIAGPGRRAVLSRLFRPAGILLCIASMAFQPAAHAASSVTIGGPFALKALNGTTVTDRTYHGRWLLVAFGYTSCPDICPTTLFGIAAALKDLGSEADRLRPVFITLDPERDTPEVLGEYVRSFDPRIVGLSGEPDEIAAVVQAYGAYAARRETGTDPRRYLMDHSNYIYLMSPQGTFVRAFDAGWSGETIASVLREIMARPSAGAPDPTNR